MRFGRRLGRRFFERGCVTAAVDLVGCVLVRRLPNGERLAGRILEVEAYLGDGTDPASHSHRGRTARNGSMFGAPGRLYTYKIYGIHTCANVVCDAEGVGSAVLLRAVEPLCGLERMRAHRGLDPGAPDTLIARGPGRLAQAFALGLDCDGASAIGGDIALHRAPHGWPALRVQSGPRIGISKAALLPYRFHAADDALRRWISPGPRGASSAQRAL